MASDWDAIANADRGRRQWGGVDVGVLLVLLLGIVGGVTAAASGHVPDGGLEIPGSAVVGLAGLAAAGKDDEGDDVGALVEKIERVQAGETDVDFETDREDEVGRLYEAVESLASSGADDDADAADQYRRELHRVAADTELASEERVQRFLELGCERLGLENGFVTRTDAERDRYEVETAAGGDVAEVDMTTDRVQTLCRDTATSDEIVEISDGRDEDLEDGPGETGRNVDCYVGRSVEVDGELYGTVSFVDPDPCQSPLTHEEKLFVDLVARLVSQELERRGRTEALRVRNRALESAPVGVTITDPTREDNPIVYANERFEELTGYPPEESIGRNCRFLQGEGTAAEPVAELREAIAAEESVTTELRNYRRDGTEFWNRVSVSPVENDAGEVTHFVGFQEDVTERKTTQRELERHTEFTDEMLDAIDDVFYVLDEDGYHERWNETLTDVLGYTDGEISSMHALDAFPEGEHRKVEAAIRAAFETGQARVEATYVTRDGEEIPYEFVASAVENLDGDRVIAGIGRDISERKEYERRLEAIVENTTNQIYIKDEDGVYEFANQAAADVFGLDETEMVGKTDEDLFDAESVAHVREVDDQVLETGENVTEETVTTVDGERHVFRSNKFPYRDEDGEILGLLGISQDITERRKYERELERQSKLLDALFEQIPVNLYLKDEEGRHVRTSAAYLDEEYPDDEEWFRGKTDLDIYSEELAEETYADDMQVIEAGESIHEKEEYNPEDDEWALTSKVPWRDEDDDIRGLIGLSQNITEQKEREQELRETKRHLKLVLEGTNTGIWEWDLETDEVDWDETLERLIGLKPGEFAGTFEAFERRVHPDDAPQIHADVDRALENDGLFKSEFRLRHEDGGWVWVGARARVVFDEDGHRRMVGINNDITERKEYERELERTTDLLSRAEEMANIGGWSSDVTGKLPYDVKWTDNLYDIFELPHGQELPRADVIEYYHQEDRERHQAAIDRAIESGEGWDQELRLVTAEGTERWVHNIGEPIVEDGETVEIRGSLQDITERKERERELREREQRLERYREYTENVLDAVDDVFYLVDDEWNLRRWNESLTEVTGYTDAEVAEMNVRDFFAADDADRVVTALGDIENRVGEPLEAEFRTKSGETIPFEFVAAPLQDPDGNEVVAGIGRDISERKEKERQLSRLIDNVPGYVYRSEATPPWEVEFVSEGVRDITGYEPELLENGTVSVDADLVAARNDELEAEIGTALEQREPFHLSYPIETADGGRRWLKEQGRGIYDVDGSVEAIEGVVIDDTERKRYEQELERTKDLLEQAGRLARVGGWELDLTTDPPEMAWTDELYRVLGLPVGTDIGLEETIEFYHPGDRERIRDAIEMAIDTGRSYDEEARIHTADGEQRWVRAIGRSIQEDGEIVTLRGALQDITVQKERELALQSLHDTARELLHTESESEVAELVVETAATLFDVPGVAIYTIDDASNRLAPVAATDGFERLSDGAPAVGVGDDAVLWNCFASGERVVFDDAETARQSSVFGDDVDSGLLVPMGDHGVFVVATDGPRVDDEIRRLAETLVATTEAAFDRLASEADLRKRDAELEEQNQRLRRQVGINDIIRRVDQSLVGATSREEVESEVCDRLVESDDVAFAWIGGFDGEGGELVPRTWAGAGQTYLDTLSLDQSAAEPSMVTANTGETTVVSNVVDGLREDAWRRGALANDFHSVISVPLSVDEYSHGVLTVYAGEPDVFGDLEGAVFAELGQSIANAINAVSAREALHADTVVEVTLQFDDPNGVLARVARDADCEVEYEGISTRSADETRLFFAATGAPADDVAAVLEELYTVTEFRLVSESDGRALFEATVTGTALPSMLVDQGASPRSIRATPTGMEAVVDLPTSTDVREFVETLRETFPSAELASRRNVERGMGTRQQMLSSLLEKLTDRQLEVLRTAYFAGFFEWPRASTGEEVAEMLDVTQPTVNRHLRLGQQRLLAQLFDEEAPDLVAA